MAAGTGDRFPDLTISFRRADSPDPYCVEYADFLHAKFTAPHPRHPELGAYENGASILPLPDTYESYWDDVGYYTRRKIRRALKQGYSFERIERSDYLDDIYEINTSRAERQGRPMSEAYRKRPEQFAPLPRYDCPNHQLCTYGVLRDGRLYAYAWVYQAGEMCLFSTILGHGDHLSAGVMYLLVAETIRDLVQRAGTKYAMYNMHFSGLEGLRFFKEQMGFEPYRVLWLRGDEAPDEVSRMVEQRRKAPRGAAHSGVAGPSVGQQDRRHRVSAPAVRRVARRGWRLMGSALGSVRTLFTRAARLER